MQTSELLEFSERLGREWLVQETGTVGDVVVEVDLTGVSFSNTHVKNFGLVIDDDGDFTGGHNHGLVQTPTLIKSPSMP